MVWFAFSTGLENFLFEIFVQNASQVKSPSELLCKCVEDEFNYFYRWRFLLKFFVPREAWRCLIYALSLYFWFTRHSKTHNVREFTISAAWRTFSFGCWRSYSSRQDSASVKKDCLILFDGWEHSGPSYMDFRTRVSPLRSVKICNFLLFFLLLLWFTFII